MGSWWSKLWPKRGAKAGAAAGAEAEGAQRAGGGEALPALAWIEAAQSPFGVRMLDLTPITKGMLSATSDRESAERAGSWGGSAGDELDAAALAYRAEIACALRYPAAARLPDGVLFAPLEMEEKWVLALRGDRLLAARSWTGEVQIAARVRRDGDELVVEGVRFADAEGLAALGDPVRVFDWLVRSHALDQLLPLPVDERGAALLERAPLVVFSLFGSRALCAAPGWDPPPPPRPLRVRGRVLRAVLRGDDDELRALAARGESLDTPAPPTGATPLCAAVIRDELERVELLLALGADPTLGDDRGLFPLGQAIVHGAGTEVMEALLAGGARIDAANRDGFGVLHAAGETDRGELVPFLAGRGAPLEVRTRHGHTPLHIACALGHADAARALLAAGADPGAADPDGATARDLAAREGHPAVVTLLDHHAGAMVRG